MKYLNPKFQKALPHVLSLLKKSKKESPLKSYEFVQILSAKKIVLKDSEFRSLVNYVRTEGLLPVVASKKGYYATFDAVRIKQQIDSLNKRAKLITASANGLKKFL